MCVSLAVVVLDYRIKRKMPSSTRRAEHIKAKMENRMEFTGEGERGRKRKKGLLKWDHDCWSAVAFVLGTFLLQVVNLPLMSQFL